VKSLQAIITLEYKDEKTAKAIAQAVSPDNLKTPSGLHVKTERDANKVITQIDCESKLATLTATIDDLLFSISTAEKALKTIK
jgi:tRNA threonylcarbamoyladenosine modification (KEOPS) complex  Pcc1 subunit